MKSQFEVETTAMLAAMLHGPTATGSVTSGVVESIMLAVKAYRDHSRDELGILSPEIVRC